MRLTTLFRHSREKTSRPDPLRSRNRAVRAIPPSGDRTHSRNSRESAIVTRGQAAGTRRRPGRAPGIQEELMASKGTIGILTGGGDVPGLNPAIRAITMRALREGYRVIGIRRGWAGLVDLVPEKDADNSECVQVLTEDDRQPRRPHGRHVPAHLADPAEPPAPAAVPPHLSDSYAGRDQRRHPRGAQEPRVPRGRLPDPDRRRRHPQLRRAAARRGGERGGDPEDDGQRRPRDRLLHRLQHLRHPHHRARRTACAPRPARTSASWSSRCSAAMPASRRCCPPWPARRTAA